MKWFPDYEPVKNPVEDKRGWNFPYNGDDWPEEDDWYWIWAGNERTPEPYPSTPPRRAWWNAAKQSFSAVTADVLAWRKAVVVSTP